MGTRTPGPARLQMTPIYHITHFSHLGSIIREGGLRCDRDAQALCSVPIGHAHIKARRMRRPVRLHPGGTLGDYVPFYFAPRSPMLYAIDRGAVEGYAGGQTEVVHLVTSVETVSEGRLAWLFTEGHAEIEYTEFFNDLKDLDKIDWALMHERYWHETNSDPDRKRRRQAEFLVHRFVPWSMVDYVGVRNDPMRETVLQQIRAAPHRPQVGVEAGWYY
jgi:ssDNA thymidine ADP-ribosyltransferase, DarT